MKLLQVTTALLALTLSTNAQRRHSIYLTEVLVNPIGSNLGKQVAEIWNDDRLGLDTTGWYIVTGSESLPLPSVVIPRDGILRIHFGMSGVNSPADIFLPTSAGLGFIDTLAIYRSEKLNDPQEMLDFVSWNGGTNKIIDAVIAREWPSGVASVALPTSEGASISHYADDSYGHDSNSADAWFADQTPTLGTTNDTGSIYSKGDGCVGYQNPIFMGGVTRFHRPWVGEPCEVSLHNYTNSPGVALVIFGMQFGNSISMDPFGMPGCMLRISADAVVPIQTGPHTTKLSAMIPNNAGLAGSRFYMQALVVDTAVPNAATALMTNALVATIGSR